MGRPHLKISDPGLVESRWIIVTAALVSTKALTLCWLISHLTNITFPSAALVAYLIDWSSLWLSLFVDCLDGSGGVTNGGTPPCWRFPDCQCFVGSHSTGIHVDIVPFYHTCSIVHIFFLETSWLLLLLAVSPSALLIARSNYEPRLVHYGFLRLL